MKIKIKKEFGKEGKRSIVCSLRIVVWSTFRWWNKQKEGKIYGGKHSERKKLEECVRALCIKR
jgi:hypothetical protein